MKSRDIQFYICTWLSFFLKWKGLYKVSEESIDATLGVLCREVVEHECSRSPCEIEHSHGIRIGYCEEIFHQSQAKVNEGEVLSKKIQN